MAKAPTSDIGRPDLSSAWGSELLTEWYETAADLRWPTSATTYGRMRHDPQLKATLAGYRMPLMRATWALDPEGCSDEVVHHVADDLGLGILGTDMKPGPARRRGVIWHRHLKEAIGYLTFGHMPFERRYEYDAKGAAHLVNLGARSPWTIAEMKIDDHGVLQSITQNTQREPVAANRLVWYVNDMEGANWAGTSMLRPAFGAWLLKHETWRVHATSIRRFGMGVPTVEAPAGATQQQVLQAQQLASAMRSGDSAGMGIPQGFKASIMGMTGSTPDALGFIRYLDQSMAKMMLEGFLELGQTETGSRSLGESFLDMFNLALQSVADEIATTATSGANGLSGIVTDLVDQNWGEGEPAPRIVCTDVGENYDITAESLNSLVTSGAITPDPALDEWIRKTWRLPKRSDKWSPKGAQALSQIGNKPGVPGQPGAKPDDSKPGDAQPTTPKNDEKPVTTTGGWGVAAAKLRTRMQHNYIEASQWEPSQHQDDWEKALAALLLQYRSVMSAQRTDLVDRVIAAMQSGNGERGLILAAPGTGQGPDLVTQAMVEVARRAAQSMVDEADRQGVRIDMDRVGIDAVAMGGTAQARAEFHAGWMAQQATAKALQVYGPTPEGYLRAADEVDNYLSGLSDASIRDQLGAALTAAQNHGRLAVLEAADPKAKATYVAAEFLDKNTCDHCRKIDGAEFDTIEAATAAYPTGGYAGCEGLMRCRGTVVAVWGDNPPTPGSGRYPYKTQAAHFNPLQPRDPHSGKWWRTGGAIKQTIDQFTNDKGDWTPERSRMHDRIVDDMLSGHSPQEHPVATYFGGGPAAGKSSLSSAAPDAAKIDPDEVKKMLPEFNELKAAGRKDAAPIVHEESSHVAKLAVQRAQERKINFVLDGTGDSSYDKMAKKVNAARAAGYQVHGRYVTLDTAEALRRAEARGKETGRVVPEPYLIATHASVSRVFDQAIKDGLFDGTELFDNNVPNGTPARKIAELMPDGEFRIFDQKAYDKFLAKGVAAASASRARYGAMTGDDATAILLAVLMGRTFADSGVPDTADARKLWDDMERAVDDMPDGMVPDVPAEWPDAPDAGTTASAGDVAPKVPGGDPRAVGPHGYIHGWIFVGVPFADSHIFHPGSGFGHGKVTHVDNDGKVHVKFDNGKTHSFEHRHEPKRKKPKFEKRVEPPPEPSKPEPPKLKRPPKSDKQLGKWFTTDAKPATQAAAASIYGDVPFRWYSTFTEDNPQWLGVMGWDGRMGLRPSHARSAADALDPKAETHTLEGIKTYWHEVHHSIGANLRNRGKDSSDYQTGAGWAIEEGYTELGAWLTMPAFMKAMGIYDKPRNTTNRLGVKDKRSIGQAFDDWNDPLTFTGHSTVSDRVAYGPQVHQAFRWLDDIATMEGGAHSRMSTHDHARINRVTELSIEVNRVSGPDKRKVMAEQYLRASGVNDPSNDMVDTLKTVIGVNWNRSHADLQSEVARVAQAMIHPGGAFENNPKG